MSRRETQEPSCRPRSGLEGRSTSLLPLVGLGLLVGAVALLVACATPGMGPPGTRPATVGGHTPVVFVPGVTGTKLRDPASGELVWGSSRELFLPRDGGHRFGLPLVLRTAAGAASHPQAHYETPEPIWRLRLPGWTKMVYQQLLERFEEAGYRYGDLAEPNPNDDFFFFNYDWRYGNLESVERLHRQLEALSAKRGGTEVDLICQSNAAKICRWLAKYGTLDVEAAERGEDWHRGYRVRKLILVGASNNGALRVLQLVLQGRQYVPLVGRKMLPEIFFTLRPLFEDLPATRDDLFFDETGKTLDVDLFDAQNWVEYGWSIFSREASARLEREPRADLFGDRSQQLEYLREQLDRARRLQLLLARNSHSFPSIDYYRLENTSSPTMDRALLTREREEWRTYFLGDRRVDRDPTLVQLAAAVGDAHATLSSQRGLSPQEEAALAGTANVAGGHFEAVVAPEGIAAILGFLAEPSPSAPSACTRPS